jgi:hypothetical protein
MNRRDKRYQTQPAITNDTERWHVEGDDRFIHSSVTCQAIFVIVCYLKLCVSPLATACYGWMSREHAQLRFLLVLSFAVLSAAEAVKERGWLPGTNLIFLPQCLKSQYV